MDEMEKAIQYIMKACSVSHGTALVALTNARGSISMAKDLLTSDTCKQIYGRQAREYSLD